MDEPAAAIGALLRGHRRAAGLTQEALAERAGLSRRGLQHLEAGDARPYPATLDALAAALALGPEDRARLRAAGRAAFPPPADPADDRRGRRPPAAGPTNLPLQLSSFVGRERELATTRELLAAHRLVTLTGPGGGGKTRLALGVAGRLRNGPDAARAYPDGLWLAELAPLGDAGLVPRDVAAALGIQPDPGEPAPAALTRALARRRLLLVLDNCEHVAAAAAALAAALLRGCPGVRILATSREPLRVGGETVWRVPSLTTPDPERRPGPDALRRTDAVRLFVERARAAAPGFALTADNAAAVAQVCHQLDGLPLAIELAAARVASLGVETLARRLDERFRLLTGGDRTALPRQQTLRAAVDWSYDLLTDQERLLFARLSVFAGGFTLEAAEAVGGDPGCDVLDLLPRLVDKSLVLAEARPAGATRYRLLETLRQYGRERLVAAGEAAAVHERHADHFRALATQAHLRRDTANRDRGVRLRRWLAQATAEHDNFRRALRWYGDRARAGDAAAAQRGLELAVALFQFWYVRGYLGECATWLRTFLAHRGTAAPTGTRARALTWLASVSRLTGAGEAEALAMNEQSREVARRAGDRWEEAVALYNLGAHGQARDVAGARARLEEALAIMRELDGKVWIAAVLHDLGNVAFRLGDLDGARSFQEQAVAIHHEIGEEWLQSNTLERLSHTVEARGDPERALALCQEALRLCRSLDARPWVASVLVRLAALYRARGDLPRARALLEESAAIRRQTGTRRFTGAALRELAEVARLQGDLTAARAALEEARAVEAAGAEARATPSAVAAWQEAPPRRRGRAAQPGGLTPREAEVLHLVAAGHTDRQVAVALGVSEDTVGRHLTHIFRKLDVASRAAATAFALRHGLA
jgi:non-specific serine/threonine protein kinase